MMYPWQKNVRKVDPYVPGEQPKTLDVTKLNTNENPYPPAPGVAEALKTMDADLFRRYPGPGCVDSGGCVGEDVSCKKGAGLCRRRLGRCYRHVVHDLL